MKVSFPYMGPVTAYRKLFEQLGYEVIVPPRPTQRTVELGAKNSPEFACFPFKVLMGSYIEACELGAELIFSSGGHGPCRAGFYGEIHARNLKNLGYQAEVVIFDEPLYNMKGFYNNVKRLKGDNSFFRLLRATFLTYRVMSELDKCERLLHRISPYQRKAGSAEKAWLLIQKEYANVFNGKGLALARSKTEEIIKQIELSKVEERDRIKIGIIGEIYVVLEPSINMGIENILNDLGCETERSQYLSEWVDYMLIPGKGKKEKGIMAKAEKYIDIVIGGHAKQNIGHIIDFKERGFDGIVHLKPFACLPELVTESIIPEMSRVYDIPILTLSLDEQSGLTNNLTRIEAFVDLIRKKDRGRHIS